MQFDKYFQLFLFMIYCSIILGLAFSVYFNNRRSRSNKAFAIFLLSFTAWSILGFVMVKFSIFLPILSLAQINCGVLFSTFIYLFSRFLVSENAVLKVWDFLLFLPGAVVFVFNIVRLFVPAMLSDWGNSVKVINENIIRKTDAAYVVYSFYLLVVIIAGTTVMTRGFLSEKDRQQKKRILTILLTIMIVFAVLYINNSILTIIKNFGSALFNYVMVGSGIILISFNVLGNKAWKMEYLIQKIEESEKKLKERNMIIENELDIARLMQNNLLPLDRPSVTGINYYASYIPMDKVGGDFYDLFYENGKIGIFIADVSGHGIPGAFISSMIKMALDFYWSEHRRPLDLITLLNDVLIRRSVRSFFSSAVYALLDINQKNIVYCNAGHPLPLIFRKKEGKFIEMMTCGTILGIGYDRPYKENIISLEKEDRVIFYTDGITEASNLSGEMFGEKRLEDFILKNSSKPAEEFSQNLINEIGDFTGNKGQDDDITMIVIDMV